MAILRITNSFTPRLRTSLVAASKLTGKGSCRPIVPVPICPSIQGPLLQHRSFKEFNPRRGDSAQASHSVVADALEELESAEIVIADLTGLNPNVLYELGIAHLRCDAVVLLCQRGQTLPFDLASIRCLFFDLSTVSGKEELAVNLGRILEELRQPGKPTLIDGSAERTQSVIADLKLLADLPDDELKNENHLLQWLPVVIFSGRSKGVSGRRAVLSGCAIAGA